MSAVPLLLRAITSTGATLLVAATIQVLLSCLVLAGTDEEASNIATSSVLGSEFQVLTHDVYLDSVSPSF